MRRGARRCCRALHTRCYSSATPGSALFLSPVWPERSSSAAGVRSAELVLAAKAWGFSVAYGAAAAPNHHTQLLAAQGVATHQVAPNRKAELEAVLAAVRPELVFFDRFYAEEYYSFRVRELAPAALRVLDMQDMHSLRAAREAAAKAGASPAEVLACQPDAAAPDCLRELAAIHRSDLTLVCSPVELELLSRHYGIPMCKLVPAPLFFLPSLYDPGTFGRESASSSGGGGSSGTCSSIDGGDGAPTCPGFSTRQHVMMIGNFRHKPNLDSVREACRLWPLVRQWLPASQQPPELHIYGSYPPGSASQRFHRPREGIHLKGFAPSLDIMLSYRLLLAPLRFGAGLKGKVADSWWHGLPVVTTPVGAEGMWPTAEQQQNSSSGRSSASSSSASSSTSSDPACDGFIWQEGPSSGSSGGGGDTTISSSSAAGQGPWGGLCGGSTAEELAADVATLYCHPLLWSRCQQAGFRLLRQLYDRDANLEVVRRAVAAALERREERRRSDFAGQLLWQQGLRATEYMSRYIELKERVRNS